MGNPTETSEHFEIPLARQRRIEGRTLDYGPNPMEEVLGLAEIGSEDLAALSVRLT
jgi:hypothetical protein